MIDRHIIRLLLACVGGVVAGAVFATLVDGWIARLSLIVLFSIFQVPVLHFLIPDEVHK